METVRGEIIIAKSTILYFKILFKRRTEKRLFELDKN
jgi:hypothetical protein